MLHPNAVRGTLAAIAIDFGISIIPTRNSEDTAAMIKRIAVREQNGEKTHIQIRTDKKPVSLWEQQLLNLLYDLFLMVQTFEQPMQKAFSCYK